ncbi:MAG: prepilin-type N-terminal cleavage/methylation domain-containing protein [Candidatus Doudnabacteria bacterium]
MFNRKNKGFTLIELLVVIAIIGILASIVLVSLNSARQKSRDARRLADIRQVMTALEIFYNDNNRYPLPLTASTTGPTPADGSPAWSTYVAIWPTTPTPNDGACTAPQNLYTYTQGPGGTAYKIAFCLGALTGGYPGGVPLYASGAGISTTAPF